jgi:hypothetical protein
MFRLLTAKDPTRTQAEKGLVGAKETSEWPEEENLASHAVDTEKRPPFALRLKRNKERILAASRCRAANAIGEFRDRGPQQQRGKRELFAEGVRDPSQYQHSDQRIASQLKKIIVHAEAFDIEEFPPNLNEASLHLERWRAVCLLAEMRNRNAKLCRQQGLAIDLTAGVHRKSAHRAGSIRKISHDYGPLFRPANDQRSGSNLSG